MAEPRQFRALPQRSRARVRARAPGHDFVAEGTGVGGEARLLVGADGIERVEALSAHFPLAALDAGDPLGNRELRRFLDLDRDPQAALTLLLPLPLSRGQEGTGMARFTIGARAMETSLHLMLKPADGRLEGRFALLYSALGYTPPRLLFMSVKDALAIEVDVEYAPA